jgi:hypothetical protein
MNEYTHAHINMYTCISTRTHIHTCCQAPLAKDAVEDLLKATLCVCVWNRSMKIGHPATHSHITLHRTHCTPPTSSFWERGNPGFPAKSAGDLSSKPYVYACMYVYESMSMRGDCWVHTTLHCTTTPHYTTLSIPRSLFRKWSNARVEAPSMLQSPSISPA